MSLHYKTLHIFLSTFVLLQVSSAISFTYFFSDRVKQLENVIIKNETNLWLEMFLHLKNYHFLIFVRLNLAFLENCARM